MNNGEKELGFTLIEMIVVLVIAAMAIAVAVPGFNKGMSSLHLKSASRDIASALRHTRTVALNQSQEATFFIDVEERFYSVSDRSKHYSLPKELEYSLFTADSEIVDDIGGSIRFFPDGSSTGGRVSIISEGVTLRIDVNWLTGQVKVTQTETTDAL